MHFFYSGLEFNETIVLAELCVPWAVLPPHHFCQLNSRKKDQVCNHLVVVSHFIFLSSFTNLRNHTHTPGCLPVHGLLASFPEVYHRKQEMYTVELRASALKEGSWKEQPHTHIHVLCMDSCTCICLLRKGPRKWANTSPLMLLLFITSS